MTCSWSAVHPEATVRVSLLSTWPGVMVSPAGASQTAAIKAALERLNGTDAAAVSLMTRLDADELGDLGGLPKHMHQRRASDQPGVMSPSESEFHEAGMSLPRDVRKRVGQRRVFGLCQR